MVPSTDNPIESAIIIRHPGPPPTGRISTLPKRIPDSYPMVIPLTAVDRSGLAPFLGLPVFEDSLVAPPPFQREPDTDDEEDEADDHLHHRTGFAEEPQSLSDHDPSKDKEHGTPLPLSQV